MRQIDCGLRRRAGIGEKIFRLVIPADLCKAITLSVMALLLCATLSARAEPPFQVRSVTPYVDSGIMLTWNSVPGALYEIQFSDNLAANSWQTLVLRHAFHGHFHLLDRRWGFRSSP